MTAIAYVDGARFRKSMLAASAHVRGMSEELDRINVFPVPDGDTGTNLALTLQSIAERLSETREPKVGVVAEAAAQGAILGARGNSGMLLSHFLLGLATELGDRARIDTATFARAVAAGARAVGSALEKPVEGTIVTVMRDTAEEATRDPGDDFVALLERMVAAARASLARTPELLPVLSKAGVVDAGAQGFVHLLEGVLRLVRGEADDVSSAEWGGPPSDLGAANRSAPSRSEATGPSAAARTAFPEASERFRYCTEGLVRGPALPDRAAAVAALAPMGDSVIALRSGALLKVHIHTDDPERVFALLAEWGDVEAKKAEDMRAQHDAAERAEARRHVTLARRPVAVVTDSACDLPEELVRRHGIRIVPLELVEEGRTFRDRLDVTAETFHAKLESGGALPTTSQPAPAAFVEAFQEAAGEAETIVGVFVGSTLSGTYASAKSAADRFDGAPVHLADSLGASLLEGLLALRAAELAEEGVPAAVIVERLADLRKRSGILFTVETFDRLIASGRVSLGRAFLGRLLGLKPILGVEPDGRVAVVGKARGSSAARGRLLDLVRDRIGEPRGRVRFGIVHVGAPELVEEVAERLRSDFGPEVGILVAPATPVLATHLGIGAWGVAYTVDDG